MRLVTKRSVFVSLLATSLFGSVLCGQENPMDVARNRQVRAAIEKALILLERASKGSSEKRTCFTCHGQALPVLAITEARSRGFEIDERNLQRQLDHTAAHLRRGLRFLLNAQREDGSWRVVSRSKPFQKYFETVFPTARISSFPPLRPRGR